MDRFDEETIEKLAMAFSKYDPNSTGSLNLSEVADIFSEYLHHRVTEHDLFSLLSEVETSIEYSGGGGVSKDDSQVNFSTFLQMLDLYVQQNKESENEEELIDAFVAMGGSEGKTGKIQFERVRQLCQKFHLTVDTDALMKKLDLDSNGAIDYNEFKTMLTKNYFSQL